MSGCPKRARGGDLGLGLVLLVCQRCSEAREGKSGGREKRDKQQADGQEMGVG